MTSTIRRWIETDTGHRVPNHKSKCKHIHGHRYRWEVEIEGDVVADCGGDGHLVAPCLSARILTIPGHLSTNTKTKCQLHGGEMKEIKRAKG